MKEGETFLVKEIFKGLLWNRIPKGDSLLLGSLFLDYVGNDGSNLTVIHKGTTGQQGYQKH